MLYAYYNEVYWLSTLRGMILVRKWNNLKSMKNSRNHLHSPFKRYIFLTCYDNALQLFSRQERKLKSLIYNWKKIIPDSICPSCIIHYPLNIAVHFFDKQDDIIQQKRKRKNWMKIHVLVWFMDIGENGLSSENSLLLRNESGYNTPNKSQPLFCVKNLCVKHSEESVY